MNPCRLYALARILCASNQLAHIKTKIGIALIENNLQLTLSTRAPRSGVPARLGVRVMRLVSCELPCALAFACEAGATLLLLVTTELWSIGLTRTSQTFDKPFEQ